MGGGKNLASAGHIPTALVPLCQGLLSFSDHKGLTQQCSDLVRAQWLEPGPGWPEVSLVLFQLLFLD